MICRNCGAGLEAGRIDPSLGVVTCSHCGSLHDISRNTLTGSSDSANESHSTSVKTEHPEVAMPNRFKVLRGDGSIQVSWLEGGLFQGFVLCIIGAGFVYAAVTSGMLFLLVACIGLYYFAAVRAFNKHEIRVDGARVQVTQGPLPWPGTRKLDASDISQLFSTEHESRVESGKNGQGRVQIRKYYSLSANTRSSGQVRLLSGLGDPRQALWLEQEIESLLGIANTRVAGEYSL